MDYESTGLPRTVGNSQDRGPHENIVATRSPRHAGRVWRIGASRSDAHGDTHLDAYPDGDTHRHADGDADEYADWHLDESADCHSDECGEPHADRYPDVDAHGNRDADGIRTPRPPPRRPPCLPPGNLQPASRAHGRHGIIGLQDDGTFVGHNGRRAGGIGASVVLHGVSQAFVTHPTQPLAYVSAYGDNGRHLEVVNFATHGCCKTCLRPAPGQGGAVRRRQAAVRSAGDGRHVVVYDVGDDGLLTKGPASMSAIASSRCTPPRTAGRCGPRRFTERELVAIDLPALQVRKRILLPQGAWDILELQSRSELYISDLAGHRIAVVDTNTEASVAAIDVQSSPARMAQEARRQRRLGGRQRQRLRHRHRHCDAYRDQPGAGGREATWSTPTACRCRTATRTPSPTSR